MMTIASYTEGEVNAMTHGTNVEMEGVSKNNALHHEGNFAPICNQTQTIPPTIKKVQTDIQTSWYAILHEYSIIHALNDTETFTK